MITSKSNKRMALATKLFLGFGVLILILAGVTVGIVIATGQVKDRAQYAQTESVAHAIIAKDMKIHVTQVQQFLSDISATRGLDGYDDGFRMAEQNAQGFWADLKQFEEMFEREKNREHLRQIEEICKVFAVYY